MQCSAEKVFGTILIALFLCKERWSDSASIVFLIRREGHRYAECTIISAHAPRGLFLLRSPGGVPRTCAVGAGFTPLKVLLRSCAAGADSYEIRFTDDERRKCRGGLREAAKSTDFEAENAGFEDFFATEVSGGHRVAICRILAGFSALLLFQGRI